eukprot:NODE_464_length_2220_cov_24.142331_g429_i0.p1 GENE.NODE_464_length_2220_cov_24.142331_g429_i0~~NODE_464_length_2220_cov_24.142331_g429_i0.p1  ORF type:complete len:615 (-),score=108.54 NODE_464_length_2220_cov_24.142331_g429_i0:139-1983(-)
MQTPPTAATAVAAPVQPGGAQQPGAARQWKLLARNYGLVFRAVHKFKLARARAVCLTPTEREIATAAFHNSLGLETAEHIQSLLASLGQNLLTEEIHSLLRSIGYQPETLLQLPQFLELVRRLKHKRREEQQDEDIEVLNAFNRVSTNGLGRDGVTTVGRLHEAVSQFEVDAGALLPDCEDIGDEITYEQFSSMVSPRSLRRGGSGGGHTEDTPNFGRSVNCSQDYTGFGPERASDRAQLQNFRDAANRRGTMDGLPKTTIRRLKIARNNPNPHLNSVFSELEDFLKQMDDGDGHYDTTELSSAHSQPAFTDYVRQNTVEQKGKRIRKLSQALVFSKMQSRALRRLSGASGAAADALRPSSSSALAQRRVSIDTRQNNKRSQPVTYVYIPPGRSPEENGPEELADSPRFSVCSPASVAVTRSGRYGARQFDDESGSGSFDHHSGVTRTMSSPHSALPGPPSYKRVQNQRKRHLSLATPSVVRTFADFPARPEPSSFLSNESGSAADDAADVLSASSERMEAQGSQPDLGADARPASSSPPKQLPPRKEMFILSRYEARKKPRMPQSWGDDGSPICSRALPAVGYAADVVDPSLPVYTWNWQRNTMEATLSGMKL